MKASKCRFCKRPATMTIKAPFVVPIETCDGHKPSAVATGQQAIMHNWGPLEGLAIPSYKHLVRAEDVKLSIHSRITKAQMERDVFVYMLELKQRQRCAAVDNLAYTKDSATAALVLAEEIRQKGHELAEAKRRAAAGTLQVQWKRHG